MGLHIYRLMNLRFTMGYLKLAEWTAAYKNNRNEGGGGDFIIKGDNVTASALILFHLKSFLSHKVDEVAAFGIFIPISSTFFLRTPS